MVRDFAIQGVSHGKDRYVTILLPNSHHHSALRREYSGMTNKSIQQFGVVVGRFSRVVACLFLLISFGGATAAGKRASWQLINDRQKNCVNVANQNDDLISYYGVWVKGSWRSNLNAGLDGAPAGSVIWGDYLPVPPGSSDGIGSLAYVVLQIAPDTPLGRYTMNLWVDDGTTRETVPVMILVTDDCGGY